MFFYVYLLRSVVFRDITYVGYTERIKDRLECHNAGFSIHTAKYRPWVLETYVVFSSEMKATRFERYLKSGSGRSFAKRHLW